MNTSEYIRTFWEEDAKKPFSANETRLYFFLLDMMVKQSCVQFECSMRYLETCLLLPKMTITRSREKLSQRGLIQVVKGDRKVKNPIYFLCGVTNNVTKVLPIALPKRDQKVTNQKEETSPTPPKEENNIYNNKETSSNDDVKKDKLSSHTQAERMDWGAFMQTFNEMLSPYIPKIISVTEKRRKLVKARISEHGKEKIMEVYDKIKMSDFLSGRKRRPNDTWVCNFDFIFSESGFRKILEGNYDNGEQRTQTNHRASTKPSFANYNEAEAKQVGSINSIEL